MTKKILCPLALLLFLMFALAGEGYSFAIIHPVPPGDKTEITGMDLQASVFVKMSAKDFTAVSGRKLNFFQKIYFKVIQRQVKRDLKKNPGLMMNAYFAGNKTKFKFDLLWFVVASIIGPLGVILAYTDHQKQKHETTTKKDKINSAWLGILFWLLWFGSLFIF